VRGAARRPLKFAVARTVCAGIDGLARNSAPGQDPNKLRSVTQYIWHAGVGGHRPGVHFFPNPQTTYFQTANLCFRPNQILVIRGKAPVFPNTYPLPPLGGSVFKPAFGEQIQLRYWSVKRLGHGVMMTTDVQQCRCPS
jgi:hypothetical protein